MSDNTAADEGCPVEYFDFKKNLPKPVLERINAVKNVTQEITDVEQKFHEELHALEVKYNAIYRYKRTLQEITLNAQTRKFSIITIENISIENISSTPHHI